MSPIPAGHTPRRTSPDTSPDTPRHAKLRRLLPVLAVDAAFIPAILALVLSGRGRDLIGIGSLTLLHAVIALFIACSAAVVWFTLVRPARDARTQVTVWERR